MKKALILTALLIRLLFVYCFGTAQTTSLVLGIVATENAALRPLELNQRDLVSVLNLIYEGLFRIDDDYIPQPQLAYSYEFTNEGKRLIVVPPSPLDHGWGNCDCLDSSVISEE